MKYRDVVSEINVQFMKIIGMWFFLFIGILFFIVPSYLGFTYEIIRIKGTNAILATGKTAQLLSALWSLPGIVLIVLNVRNVIRGKKG